MGFKKVFRGYDPEEVDKFVADTAARDKVIRSAQKERIDELTDENYTLRQQLKQYQADEQAISKSLIASEQLAQELKNDAEKYSNLVLSRAKIFYAAWRAYSKTLIAALSAEEVREFNKLQKKLENTINAYEGSDDVKKVAEDLARDRQVAATTANSFDNPIDKVEQACDQAIDLRELSQPEQSLEELCQELGLIRKGK